MNYTLNSRDFEWLKTFCLDQITKIENINSLSFWESYPLTSYPQFISLSSIFSVELFNRETAGYVIISSLEKDILLNIYILTEHRNKGLCSAIIDQLNIKRLSCIAQNTNALRLYEKLGFQQIKTNDPFSGSVKLCR